jgi:hypothetical protein
MLIGVSAIALGLLPYVVAICAALRTPPSPNYVITTQPRQVFQMDNGAGVATKIIIRDQGFVESFMMSVSPERAPMGRFAQHPTITTKDLPSWTHASIANDLTQFRRWDEIAYGWPFLCLSSELSGGGWKDSIVIGNHRLPARILWPGSFFNALCYTTPIWLPYAFVFARRMRRRRENQCVNCGYILHSEASRCSECGQVRSYSAPIEFQESIEND